MTKEDELRELLKKFGTGISITPETARELAERGTPTLGLPITEIGDDNDVVLGCAFWLQHCYPDDKRGLCDRCGEDICYRPHAAKAKMKVCMNCLPDVVRESEEKELAEKKAAEKAAAEKAESAE